VVHTLELARLPPFRAPERPVRWTVARPGPNDGDAGAPTPFARPRDPVQEATIDLPRVLAVVRAHARALRDCYETFLSAEAPIAGRVELRLTVSVEGRVLDAEARGPEALRPTMRCVEGLFAGMLLPPARGGAVDVALPFEFSPVGGAGAEPNTPR
jgi:hypothetical protein